MDRHDLGSFVTQFHLAIDRYRRLFDERVYPPFADIDRAAHEEAQPLHDKWMADRWPEPEAYDAGEAADHFTALSQRTYDQLFSMQTILTNLFTAGLYHSFEQQMLAMLLHDGQPIPRQPTTAFSSWAFSTLQLDVTTSPGWRTISELRLVANVVKHAEGNSERDLRQRRPDLFDHPLLRDPAYAGIPRSEPPVRAPLAGEDLYLIKADFDHYAQAVSGFWQWFGAAFQALADDA
jgi:hypothetical protein